MTRRPAPCSSGKQRYRDRLQARIALAGLRANPHPRRQEQRSYYCPACSGWHLTSQPRRRKDRRT
ncbi:hypothetical protein [Streptomyces sp. NPDC056069]|uniref:hypothetical protein n=1 Tax=Streptomyces sp. NPDC056069 TaxID=3345702 RepID=UPI0035DFA619